LSSFETQYARPSVSVPFSGRQPFGVEETEASFGRSDFWQPFMNSPDQTFISSQILRLSAFDQFPVLINSRTCDVKNQMSHSDSDSDYSLGFHAEALPGLSSPASPVFPCSASRLCLDRATTSRFLAYSDSSPHWSAFVDPCPDGRAILWRNAVTHRGKFFEVRWVSGQTGAESEISSVLISRNVAGLGEGCLLKCHRVEFVAFEANSLLSEIGLCAFSASQLQSIVIPSSVSLLAPGCFSGCPSLRLVTFERPSSLATIKRNAFFGCQSLNRFLILASVREIEERAFGWSGLRSIEIEEGSVSFRVVNEFLVDFEVCSLLCVIGSPESIQIPSSIEELQHCCAASKECLIHVEFEPDSNLRSIGVFAFEYCKSLESIRIPSSVEVLARGCFRYCSSLRKVTFGADSKLRLIEADAFWDCRVLKSIWIPSLVEVLPEGSFRLCWGLRRVKFGAESKLRLIEEDAFRECRSLELVSVPESAQVFGSGQFTFVTRLRDWWHLL
jgi:hypothetical protein